MSGEEGGAHGEDRGGVQGPGGGAAQERGAGVGGEGSEEGDEDIKDEDIRDGSAQCSRAEEQHGAQ